MTTLERSHREIVECYHGLLTKNLILTEDFYRTLITHGVFSEHLVNDIKKAPSNDRAAKLIELLLTRTVAGFRKFVDVLAVTGHHFLSDCLREAENYEPIRDVDVTDLGNKLPFINKTVKTEQQRSAVRQFFREAIQKEVVKHTWKGDISTKEQLIMARQKNIDQLWHFEEGEKIKEKSLQDLQEQYLSLQAYSDDLRREVKSLEKHIDDLTRKHRDDLKAQVDYNMANDRHLTRLNEKAEDAGTILEGLHDILRDTMDSEYQSRQTITSYQNLQNNFEVFCTQYREMSNLVEHFRDERHYLSNQVSGNTITDKSDLKSEYRNYMLRNEEELNNMRLEINKLQDCLSQKSEKIMELELARGRIESGDRLIDSNMIKLETVRRELEENKHRIISRDDKILSLEKQSKVLNEKIRSLEDSLLLSQQNEQHLKDAVAAAAESKIQETKMIKANQTQMVTLQGVISETPKQHNNSPEKTISQSQYPTMLQPNSQNKASSKPPAVTSATERKTITVSRTRSPPIMTTHKRAASPMVISPELQQSEEPRSAVESVEKFPGPPPPTQHHKTPSKLRNRTQPVDPNNAYLLKKTSQGGASVFLMDDSNQQVAINQKSTDHFSKQQRAKISPRKIRRDGVHPFQTSPGDANKN